MTTSQTFHLTISKVNELLYKGDALSVTVPGLDGELTLLAHHEALVSLLKKGTIVVRDATSSKTFSIEKGIIETSNNQITVLI